MPSQRKQLDPPAEQKNAGIGARREHAKNAGIGARRGINGRDLGRNRGAFCRHVTVSLIYIVTFALAGSLAVIAVLLLTPTSIQVTPARSQLTGLRSGDVGGSSTASPPAIRSELSNLDPVSVWNSIIEAASADAAAAEVAGHPLVAVEVGVYSDTHCVHAAEQGFLTHCFEPSPKSYDRVANAIKVKGASPEVKARVVLHREAAGPSSGGTVPFHSSGGIGDHVGEYDMWKMEKRWQDPPSSAGERGKLDRAKRGEIIEVPTVSLDDFVRDDVKGGEVYLLKMATQGYEKSIFSGLKKSIQSGAIRYVIFHFWPRGMDLMADTPGQCSARQVPDMLLDAGYDLYALKLEAHIKAPLKWGNVQREATSRPLDQGTDAYCRWFFELERRYPSKKGEEEYKFGYWSDFVAVAPGAKLPDKVFRAR